MSNETATSLRRALSVLLALATDRSVRSHGLGVMEIAGLMNREKSQVSRTLRTLNELGLVDRDPETLNYRLGWQLFALAARAGDQRLLEEASPLLVGLVREVRERAHLCVFQGGEVLTVLSESPALAVQAVDWVGRAVPAHCTSSGRALLLDHGLPELASLWPGDRLTRPGPNSPESVRDLHARIVRARAKGFAIAEEELEPGLVAVAAPVRDGRGRVVAALDVSGPKFRLEARLETVGRELRDAAEELARRVGWRAEDAAGFTGPAVSFPGLQDPVEQPRRDRAQQHRRQQIDHPDPGDVQKAQADT